MKQFFLFQRHTGADWPTKKKVGFWLWNALCLLVTAVGLGLCSLTLASGNYSIWTVFPGYLERPLLLVLNLVPVVVLMALLWAVIGRGWIAFLVTALITLGFSAGNYFKLLFRDDPLLFKDLLLLNEAGNMAGKYELALDIKLVFCILCVAVGTLFLFFLARGRANKWVRLGTALAAVLAGVLLAPVYADETLYEVDTAHYQRVNRWSPTQQYLAHGFVYPFLHSVSTAFAPPPGGYDEGQAAAHMAAYRDADIPAGQKVNIVSIMLEGFNDFSKYEGLQFASDVYGPYHALEAESYTGNLTTNIFAGGTIDTERCFLTGYSQLEDYRENTNSYVWYFKDQGYQTTGDHPCFEWFYNRKNINAYLGFDSYRFVENHYGQFTEGKVADDGIFFSQLGLRCQELAAQDAPFFSFSVSYQGHGPYDDNMCWWGDKGDFVVNQGYSDQEQYILDNYFGSIADTSRRIAGFADLLRGFDEPVVLVLFGDHNPWLGDGNSVYETLGISFDMATEEGFHNYYDTRYLIWANDAAKQALGNDFVGQGPTMGPYFLMTELFDLCAWEGPAFMQAAREVAGRVPVISVTGQYVERGRLTDVLTPENTALVDDYSFLQYYWSRKFAY